MKTIRLTLFLLLSVMMISCETKPVGTLEDVDQAKNDSIEVYRYHFREGDWVYVSRFKNCPNIVTTTYKVKEGKTTVNRGNIIIYENDSIQIIRKK